MNEWILLIAPVAFLITAGLTLYLRDWIRRARVKRQLKQREARRRSPAYLEAQRQRHQAVPLSEYNNQAEDASLD